jgi:outer membrane protein assembly factor BamB
LWSFTTGGAVYSSPAVANGVVYVGSSDEYLYAFDAGTGAKLWNFRTGSGIESAPAVANGVVYVGSFDNNVYALHAGTGAKLWSFATPNSVYSSPAVANGVVYAGSLPSLYAFDLAGGTAAARPNGSITRPDPATLVPDYSLLPSEPQRATVPVPID